MFSGGGSTSEFGAFRLSLLLLLIFVFGSGLSALERLVHVLCRLVGLAVVIHGKLRLAFLRDAHNLVTVGIYPCGFGLAKFGIILEIDGAVVAVAVFAFANKHFLSGEIIRLLLFVERHLTPVLQRLD